MNSSEILKFRIGLSSSLSHKKAMFTIGVDGIEYVNSKLSVEKNEVEYFEFECEISDDSQHTLYISFLNKLPSDTIQDSDGNIVEDFLLSIKSVEIDDIELDKLKWSLSTYYPKYPNSYLDETQKNIEEVKKCVDLGWNGTWKLTFSSPFYVWLLEHF